MLTIRPEQMAVFRAHRIKQFEAAKLSEIRQQFPTWYEQLGEEKTLRLIQAGIDKARRYGVTSRGDVSVLIDLMVRYGPDFDSRQDLEWQTEALRDSEVPDDARVALMAERFAIAPVTAE
jgi:hypothetical protein